MSRLYTHPDGHTIDFTDDGLTVTSGDGASLVIPMGIEGLRQLNKPFTEADCAFRAGAVIAESCLDAMLATDDQTDRANLLAAALADLNSLNYREHVYAGFAGAIVATIEQGLDHA